MSTIGSLAVDTAVLSSLVTATHASNDGVSSSVAAAATDTAAAAPKRGVEVSISSLGLKKSAQSSTDNSDIEESGLPDQVQQTLKRIRELKQQLAEKMAELQALMSDQNMNPETKEAKAASLQIAIGMLSAGIMAANAALAKSVKDGTMTEAQGRQAAVLAMKG